MPLALMEVVRAFADPGMCQKTSARHIRWRFVRAFISPGRMGWWLPLCTLAVTDIALNLYYLHLGLECFDLPVLNTNCSTMRLRVPDLFGRRFNPRASFLRCWRRLFRRVLVLPYYQHRFVVF